MEIKRKQKIRVGQTVRDVLNYGKMDLKEDDKRELKNLINEILKENEIKSSKLEEIGKILGKYGYSVRTIYYPEYNVSTIMFYDESKIKKSKAT